MEPFGFFPVPLESPTTQIRLLHIDHPHMSDSPLSVSLATYKLEDAPSYYAISYTWGDNTEVRDVRIDNRVCSVRVNCHFALCQARRHYSRELFWIDMLCINQKDSEEKSAQVQKMWHIFSRATKVLASIGQHADDSRFLLEPTLPPTSAQVGSQFRKLLIMHRTQLSTKSRDLCSRMEKALECLATRRYWNRLWIVQEVVAARSLQLLCGEELYDWTNAERFFGLISENASTDDHSVESNMVTNLQNVFRSRFYAQYSFFSFDQVLATFRRFECADVRDRVYGTLPLVKWSTAPLPDYSLSAFQLAVRMTEHTVPSHIAHLADALEIDLSNADLRRAVSGRLVEDIIEEKCSVSVSERRFRKLDDEWPLLRISVTPKGHWTTLLKKHKHAPNAIRERIALLYAKHSLPELVRKEIRRRKPKELLVGGEVAGFVCHQAQPGDILVPMGDRSRILFEPSVFLVVRARKKSDFDSDYDIIGQGFAMPEFYPDFSKMRETINVEIALTGEDVLVLYAQDLQSGSVEPSARFQRLVTSVTADPYGAVSIETTPCVEDKRLALCQTLDI